MKFDQPAIIFCATQRSGSTMIVDDFQNVTGRKLTQTEAFYHLVIAKKITDWDQAIGVLQQFRAGEAIFFDKVMFPHLPQLARMIAPEAKASGAMHFAKYFANATWVYIRRANIFEQTVSKYTAESLNVWDSSQAKTGFNDAINFDLDRAMDYMRALIREDHQWLTFFRRHDIRPIHICYEDAVPHYPHYLAPVLKAAGLDVDLAKAGPRRKKKVGNQRSAILADVLQNMVLRDLISHSFQSRVALRQMQNPPVTPPTANEADEG